MHSTAGDRNTPSHPRSLLSAAVPFAALSDDNDPGTSTAAIATAASAEFPISGLQETTPSILDPLVSVLLSSPLSAGTTIILLTIVFRSAVTLPATLWQRRRMKRTREIIQPAMKLVNDRLARSLVGESRRKGLSYEEYKKELKRQVSPLWSNGLASNCSSVHLAGCVRCIMKPAADMDRWQSSNLPCTGNTAPTHYPPC